MIKLFYAFCTLLLAGCVRSGLNMPEYEYRIRLDKIKDDKLAVELTFRGDLPDTSYFCLPRIVPGIYDDLNFGKYLSDFKAFNSRGKLLAVKKTDENCWAIVGARQLKKIEYIIDDGWEKFDYEGIRPYRSAESHFDSSVMILNANSIFGYFKDKRNLPFQIKIARPDGLYAATRLPRAGSSEGEDEFIAEDYRTLVDNPVMYSMPDTASVNLSNISVEVACYSSTHKKLAYDLAAYISPLLKNQTEYLGGKLATSQYTFIIYHNLNPCNSSNFADGLEHSRSTLVLIYSPFDMEILKKNIFNLASHEFFHTLMPLGLHSYEIEDFDFNNPKFSRHLWLYEGMTEYFTIHMPVKQNIEDVDEFIRVMESKIGRMKQFKDTVSMTQLSLNPMEMPEEYMNVYFKGALINLCLDIRLRELSKGKYGVQDLVRELLNRYGEGRPFKDDELFGEIAEITGFPETVDFINKYIKGNQPLPLKEYLQKAGFELNSESGKISLITPMSEEQTYLRKSWINQ